LQPVHAEHYVGGGMKAGDIETEILDGPVTKEDVGVNLLGDQSIGGNTPIKKL
jgi:hypothetical protein